MTLNGEHRRHHDIAQVIARATTSKTTPAPVKPTTSAKTTSTSSKPKTTTSKRSVTSSSTLESSSSLPVDPTFLSSSSFFTTSSSSPETSTSSTLPTPLPIAPTAPSSTSTTSSDPSITSLDSTSPSDTPSSSSVATTSSGMGVGAIVGTVGGCIAVVAVLVAIVAFLIRRCRKRRDRTRVMGGFDVNRFRRSAILLDDGEAKDSGWMRAYTAYGAPSGGAVLHEDRHPLPNDAQYEMVETQSRTQDESPFTPTTDPNPLLNQRSEKHGLRVSHISEASFYASSVADTTAGLPPMSTRAQLARNATQSTHLTEGEAPPAYDARDEARAGERDRWT